MEETSRIHLPLVVGIDREEDRSPGVDHRHSILERPLSKLLEVSRRREWMLFDGSPAVGRQIVEK